MWPLFLTSTKPRLFTALLACAASSSWLAGCTFDADTRSGLASTDAEPGASDAEDGDASTSDADIDPAADAAICAFANADLCLQGQPDGPLDFPATFNTSTDPTCRSYTPAGGQDTCLLVVESMLLPTGRTSVVTGNRPLMLAATGNIEIVGTFDISSHIGGEIGAGADDPSCAPVSLPEDDTGGSGGGAGGSFAGMGGNGGVGDTDQSLGGDGNAAAGVAGAVAAAPITMRGGCPGSKGGDRSDIPGEGQGGAGGSSGGAVYFLAAGDFNLASGGNIRATGAGGEGGGPHSGGGGGGSGGAIRIDAISISLAGNISASGGGGGEGGYRAGSTVELTGNDGQNGQLIAGSAAGGSGATDAGNGGGGSSMTVLGGLTGSSSVAAGGGGGGGAGYLLVKGSLSQTGQSSPALTLLD